MLYNALTFFPQFDLIIENMPAAKITKLVSYTQNKGQKLNNHSYKIRFAVHRMLYFCMMEVIDSMLNKLSVLTRLHFNEKEKESIKSDLQKMITFVQKMDEINTDHVEPLQHMSSLSNVWREDIVLGSCTQTEALHNADLHNKSFFMVPKVIKKQ